MNSVLSYVKECTLLGVKILPDFSSDIDLSVKNFNKKFMSVYLDFRHLQCDVLSKMVALYCLDVPTSKPYLLLSLIPVFADCLPIDISLEKRFIKFIWTCFNSENVIIRNIICFAMNNRLSILGRNFRYLAFKYKINCSYWYKDWSYINRIITLYVSTISGDDYYNH